MSIFTPTWTPEPLPEESLPAEAVAPVSAYDPLYAAWRGYGPSASFEIEVATGYGKAPRFFQADVETAIAFHRSGHTVRRMS